MSSSFPSPESIFCSANKKVKIIKIFIKELKFSSALTNPKEKIIIGILKIITMRLPRVKFLLFNKFIDPDIADIHVIITEPIKKLK